MGVRLLDKNTMRLVFVEWTDSYGCSATWQSLEDSGSAQTLICRSVGWLFRDDKNCKVIVPHMSDGDPLGIPSQGCGDMTIPSKSILRMVTLSDPSRKKSKKVR